MVSTFKLLSRFGEGVREVKSSSAYSGGLRELYVDPEGSQTLGEAVSSPQKPWIRAVDQRRSFACF